MVGAPFPGRHLARDLIASVEDALQTPTLMITIIIKVIIISVIIMAYQHIPSGQNRTMVGFITNSDDHHPHRHHHHDHNHSREFFWTLFVPPWPSEVFGPNKKFPAISLMKKSYLFLRSGTGSVASAARWAGQRLPPIFSSEFSISSAPLGFDI